MSLFLKFHNPLLRKVSKEISLNLTSSKETEKVIQRMLKIAFGQQKDNKKPIMVGLAAPQIGTSKRIILVDVAADGKGKVGDLKIFINPEITWKSDKKNEWYEGCYSIPGICGVVSRPITIKVKGVMNVEQKYTGYVGRIFQHEIDHLNGKLFVDKISDPNKLHRVKKSEFALYRNNEGWRNWPKKYPLPLANTKLKKV